MSHRRATESSGGFPKSRSWEAAGPGSQLRHPDPAPLSAVRLCHLEETGTAERRPCLERRESLLAGGPASRPGLTPFPSLVMCVAFSFHI